MYPFGRAVVLALGVNRNPKVSGLADLSFAEADATGVADVLERLYGFEAVRLIGERATKAAVEDELSRLGRELGESDVLVVFFAGHGVVIPTADGGDAGYLIPAGAALDADDYRDRDRWDAQALDMRRLTATVEGMTARHVLVAVDACCSGFMTTRGALERADLKAFLFEKSRAVLSATTQTQKARENAAAGHGYFTAALLEQLGRDEAMSVHDLFLPVLKRVAIETNGRMTPRLGHFGSGEGTFVFVPRSIPRSQIDADLAGRTPATVRPAGLAATEVRQRERLARTTTEAEAYQAMTAVPYAFAPRAEELRPEWERRFARFRENAAIDEPWAMVALHACYARGLGTARNPDLAYFWAKRLDAVAKPAGAGKYFLAECYAAGWGVPRQQPAADRLYREAADRGFLPAELYFASREVAKKGLTAAEVKAAVAVFDRGRERKFPRASALLGMVYGSGFAGVEADPKRAVGLFVEAAELNDPRATLVCYDSFGKGLPGVPRNAERAEKYLRAAADLGEPEAQYRLALEHDPDYPNRLLALRPDDREIFRWAMLAAEQGHAAAQLTVALDYAGGHGTGRNPELAREWCDKAARQGYADAFFTQGQWYRAGDVLGPRDLEKAAERFRRAADLGHPRAALAFVELHRTGPTRGFPFQSANWESILRYSVQAGKGMPPKEADDLMELAYRHLILGRGQRDQDRWDQFRKAYPDEAAEMGRRLSLPTK
ncbi:MAG: caspase family protein [Gemmataceae bacterium]